MERRNYDETRLAKQAAPYRSKMWIWNGRLAPITGRTIPETHDALKIAYRAVA